LPVQAWAAQAWVLAQAAGLRASAARVADPLVWPAVRVAERRAWGSVLPFQVVPDRVLASSDPTVP